jgi:alpha 1,3-glucosidase
VGVSAAGSPRSFGVFWFNPTETYVDVARTSGDTLTRWMSESGAWDLFLLPGPTAANVFRKYTLLTGTQAMPPKFALAYHQCRWNYKDEADVAGVDAKFEEHNFPYDVLVRAPAHPHAQLCVARSVAWPPWCAPAPKTHHARPRMSACALAVFCDTMRACCVTAA